MPCCLCLQVGPLLRNGYSGWAMTPAALEGLRAQDAKQEVSAGLARAASQEGQAAPQLPGTGKQVVVGARSMWVDKSALQGFTSMVAVLG